MTRMSPFSNPCRDKEPPINREKCLIAHLQKPSVLQNPAQGAHHARSGLQSVAHALVDNEVHIPAQQAMQLMQHWPADAAAATMRQAMSSRIQALKQTV